MKLCCFSSVVRIHSASGRQNSVPIRMIFIGGDLRVCTSVIDSKNSSSEPNPPGKQIVATAYLTNITLRTKK